LNDDHGPVEMVFEPFLGHAADEYNVYFSQLLAVFVMRNSFGNLNA